MLGALEETLKNTSPFQREDFNSHFVVVCE